MAFNISKFHVHKKAFKNLQPSFLIWGFKCWPQKGSWNTKFCRVIRPYPLARPWPCSKIMFWPLCKQFLFSNFQVFDHHFTEIDQKVYMTATLIPILALCSIRNLKRLAPISMLANMLQMVGLGLTFFYLLRDLPPTWDRKPFATW